MGQQELEIISVPKTLTLYGFSKIHDVSKTYAADMFEVMGKLWDEVRGKQLPHLGINHVVYDCGDIVFAGVELSGEPETILEKKQVTLQKYAYWKHIGPYSELGNVYDGIRSKLQEMGLTPTCPGMEIYGHPTEDESKLETEIFMSIE